MTFARATTLVKDNFLPILHAVALEMRLYIETNCGSASIGRCIEGKSGYVFSDLDPSLMCLLYSLKDGTFETHPHISTRMHKEEFQQILRETENDMKTDKNLDEIVNDADLYKRLLKRGIACYVYDYWNNPRSYKPQDEREYYTDQIKDFQRLAASPAFKACDLRTHSSYEVYSNEKGAVIFADPPYNNCKLNETHCPILKHAPFCHDTFWRWFRKVSIANFAYCSEMSAPAEMVAIREYTAGGRREFIFVAPNSLAHKLYLELFTAPPQQVHIKFPSSAYQANSSIRNAGKRTAADEGEASGSDSQRPRLSGPNDSASDLSTLLLDDIKRRLKDGVKFVRLDKKHIFTLEETFPGGVDAYFEKYNLFVSNGYYPANKMAMRADATFEERKSDTSQLYKTQCCQIGYALIEPRKPDRDVFKLMPKKLRGAVQTYKAPWPEPRKGQTLVKSLSIDLAKMRYWADYQFAVDNTFTAGQAINFAVKIVGNAVVPALVTEIAKYANQFSLSKSATKVHSIIDGFCSGGTVAYGFEKLLSLKQAFGIDCDAQVLQSFTHNLTRVCGMGGGETVGKYCGTMPTTFDDLLQLLKDASWKVTFKGTHLHLSPPCQSGVVDKKENQFDITPYLHILEAFANHGGTVSMEEGKNFKHQMVAWLGKSAQRSTQFYLYMICASDCGLLTRRLRCILTNYEMVQFNHRRVGVVGNSATSTDTPSSNSPDAATSDEVEPMATEARMMW